jgi:aminoglycoside N3'-acetyltransferase
MNRTPTPERSSNRLLISEEQLLAELRGMGIKDGDTVLVRASLGAIGRMTSGAKTFIDALLMAVGPNGTIVSLAFTDAAFIRRPKPENAFHSKKVSYAGALPNAMLEHPGAHRSSHPMCSYVAIGRLADELTRDHDESSGAYEPIRKIIENHGVLLLVGCVDVSPGFTTVHLAEADLGLLRLSVFPWLRSTYYTDRRGQLKVFRRRDLGLCSNSYWKFYALYVRAKFLRIGFLGRAYAIAAPAKECYELERQMLERNPKFNVCDSDACFTCNVGRWDRIHRVPLFVFGWVRRKLFGKAGA